MPRTGGSCLETSNNYERKHVIVSGLNGGLYHITVFPNGMSIILTVWSVTSILCLAIKVLRNRNKGEQPLPHWMRKLY